MLKKIWFTVLSFLATLCVCLGVACGETANFEVKFKGNIQAEMYLNDELDLEDWIIRVENASVTLRVSYKDIVSGGTITEEFGDLNTVFRAKQEGEHTLVYEAKIGKTVKSATMKFEVVPEAPKFKFASRGAQTLTLGANGKVSRSFNNLIANSSMTVTPNSSEVKVTGVSVRPFTTGLEQTASEWQELPLTENAKTYEFIQVGEYKFSVQAISGENTATDEFLVNVLTPSVNGTQTDGGDSVITTGKNVLFSEDDPYTMKLTSGTISKLSYAVIAKKYASGEKVSVMFRGSKAPQLGFNVVPAMETADPYSVMAAKGGFFSFEYKANVPWVFYYPNMAASSTAAKTPGAAYSSYTYLNQTLDESKNYLLQACFVEDKDGEVNANGKYHYSIIFEIFEVVSYEVNGKESICYVGDKITGHDEFYGGFDSETKLSHDGTVVIYGSKKDNVDVVLVETDKVQEAPLQELAVEGVQNTYHYKADVGVANGKVTSVTLAKGLITSDANGTKDNLRFIGQTEGFGLGKTISVSFKGKNLPAIGIFLGGAGDYKIGTATGGTGLYVHNSNMNHDVNLGKRIIVNGPNRLQAATVASTVAPYSGRQDALSCGISGTELNNVPVGYQLLDESKSYRFELSCLSVTYNFTLTLKYTLYEVAADGTETQVYTATKSTGISGLAKTIDFTSGTFAFYGSTMQDITFSYELKDYVGDDLQVDPFDSIPVNSFSAKYNTTTGEYQLASGTASRSDALGFNNASFGYVGLGNYSVGDTITIEFTGKNIPNIGLFASANGVQPIATGATGLFLQSSVNTKTGWSTRYALLGSYLWDAGKTVADQIGKTYTQELGKNWKLKEDTSNTGSTSLFGLMKMEDNKQYRYTITTVAVAGDAAKVTVISKIESYDADTSSWTQLKTLTWTVTHGLDSLENRYIVLYGVHTGTGIKAITFKASLTKVGE